MSGSTVVKPDRCSRFASLLWVLSLLRERAVSEDFDLDMNIDEQIAEGCLRDQLSATRFRQEIEIEILDDGLPYFDLPIIEAATPK
ncbi:hypothetical protein [Pseudohalocynthiibacter sp. F2068]|jgi:hypothetical protein|uniref:hypothetical protein n=1 Tax=Pseudohalocynthiibacter sp. F2068 TaxID=2926418 RepID=UPI001FF532DF|nr:hypothetical protein [Pseudohalocynthiibacter sp. F2068]MCK0104129.1 hypothetical protein [Pseudohalocynthiibacter sp. F2068]